MAIVFKTPDECGDEYLEHLKGQKPDVNIDQDDNDWWVRSRVTGGLAAGTYSDLNRAADDAFPQHARREAVIKHLFTYFDESSLRQPTKAVGVVKITGDAGGEVAIGDQLRYEPNGNLYEATEAVTLTGPTGEVAVQSLLTGQNQNLLEGATLVFSAPAVGIDADAEVWDGDLSDGKDEETETAAAQRVLDFIRSKPAGGNDGDWPIWAREASPAVAGVSVLRYPAGLGTVGVVISAGTTDIDEAIDNGTPVVLTPSEELIETVAAYIETKRATTDCVTVLGIEEVEIDVTAAVSFVTGDKDTVLTGQGPGGADITQGELVEMEIKRAIYKTPPGGTKIGGQGYVLASALEDQIDINLSANGLIEGEKLAIVTDRQVEDLDDDGPNFPLDGNQQAVPGTITIEDA